MRQIGKFAWSTETFLEKFEDFCELNEIKEEDIISIQDNMFRYETQTVVWFWEGELKKEE